jgi:hypothetical protein
MVGGALFSLQQLLLPGPGRVELSSTGFAFGPERRLLPETGRWFPEHDQRLVMLSSCINKRSILA